MEDREKIGNNKKMEEFLGKIKKLLIDLDKEDLKLSKEVVAGFESLKYNILQLIEFSKGVVDIKDLEENLNKSIELLEQAGEYILVCKNILSALKNIKNNISSLGSSLAEEISKSINFRIKEFEKDLSKIQITLFNKVIGLNQDITLRKAFPPRFHRPVLSLAVYSIIGIIEDFINEVSKEGKIEWGELHKKLNEKIINQKIKKTLRILKKRIQELLKTGRIQSGNEGWLKKWREEWWSAYIGNKKSSGVVLFSIGERTPYLIGNVDIEKIAEIVVQSSFGKSVHIVKEILNFLKFLSRSFELLKFISEFSENIYNHLKDLGEYLERLINSIRDFSYLIKSSEELKELKDYNKLLRDIFSKISQLIPAGYPNKEELDYENEFQRTQTQTQTQPQEGISQIGIKQKKSEQQKKDKKKIDQGSQKATWNIEDMEKKLQQEKGIGEGMTSASCIAPIELPVLFSPQKASLSRLKDLKDEENEGESKEDRSDKDKIEKIDIIFKDIYNKGPLSHPFILPKNITHPWMPISRPEVIKFLKEVWKPLTEKELKKK